jgi:glycosyltransferase involved in cell wall biosynthesis
MRPNKPACPRICIILNSLDGGGAEKSMGILYQHLLGKNVEVEIIGINESISSDIPYGRVMNRKLNASFMATAVTFLKYVKLVRQLKPNVLILNCDLPELFGAFTPLKNVAIVAVEHSEKPWNRRILLGMLVRTVLELRNTKWVSVSKHLKLWHKRNFDPAVINNSIEEFNKEYEIESGPILLRRIVFIGRLSSEKNPEFILEVGRRLKVPILFIGDGALKNDLIQECIHLELNSVFLGFKSTPFDFIRDGDLLVIPSHSEGDGMVLYESILAGIPILLSDIQAFRNVPLSFEFYFRNIDDFMETLTKNKNDLSKLIAPNCVKEVVAHERDPEKIADQWLSMMKREKIIL